MPCVETKVVARKYCLSCCFSCTLIKTQLLMSQRNRVDLGRGSAVPGKERSVTKKLLVIDDQTGITKVVELIARQLGLNARSLNDSSQATEVFIAFKPDVVMLDMIMPEKDGIDVLNEILLTGIPVKVILTSGFSDSYLRLAEGIATFHDNRDVAILRKPFRRDELITLLTDLTAA
jgi:CheY-like chemotaxis protein